MKLTESNFLQFAMKHYDNPQCYSVDEFDQDLKRFLYIKKLLNKYDSAGELRERLLLNHIIILHNLFGDKLVNMLLYKIEKKYWSYIITFLIFLNYMPEYVPEHNVYSSDYTLDENILTKLREI